MLWGAIKCKISHYERFPQTKAELQAAVKREWDSFDQDSINNLILSFRDRLLMCINVGGKSISHFISSHLTEIPQKYIVPEEERPPLFTKEEDTELFKMFIEGNYRRRWKYIATKLGGNYTPRIVKYRILLLNAINKINEGIEPSVENEDTDDLKDDVSSNAELKFITFDGFLKNYYSNKDDVERDLPSITLDTREKNQNEGIPRKKEEDNPFMSDDFSLTTDETE